MAKNIWAVLHAHRRLVRRGLVQPLRCHCGVEYHWMLGTDDDPVLWCPACNARSTVGTLRMYEIERQVRLHGFDV